MKSTSELKVTNPMIQLELAFNSLGRSMYSDEFACELLAWFHVCGGHNEAVVLNPGLSTALTICAKKLRIEGGETPDAKLFIIWKQKVAELTKAIEISDELNEQRDTEKDLEIIKPEFPVWLHKITERYKLRTPEKYFDF